ncbi:hypothetical protein [Streptomyces pimonensis]|uniref:hypothetical protein n=1 Tax=Streptomyces pimonensis TaxID=2860288 RepID=UPI003529887B
MGDLRVEAVDGDAVPQQGRHVHDVIVPPAATTSDEVRERVACGYRPENAYAGEVLVDCSTVRPPRGDDAVVTVVARVLSEHRRKGVGRRSARRGPVTRAAGAGAVGTVVPAAGEDGVRFARARGFGEVERCVPPGERAVADVATDAFPLAGGRIGRSRTTIPPILREPGVRCVTFELNDCKWVNRRAVRADAA